MTGTPLADLRPPRTEHPAFAVLVAAGWPTVDLVPGCGITGPAVVLSTHLDGSMWVLPRMANVVCVPPSIVADRPDMRGDFVAGVRTTDPETSHRAWRIQNQHGLRANQVKVLVALAAAGEWGMIDHEHEQVNGLIQTSAGKRRHELVQKGLVAAKEGPLSTRPAPKTGHPAQVWVITRAGLQALTPPRMPNVDLLVETARARAG